jgi:pyruvate,water dikinase
MSYKQCLWFNELTREDVSLAGGKGANLGEMTRAGLPIPSGFVITAQAFRQVVETCGVWDTVCDVLLNLDRTDIKQIQTSAPQLRALFDDIPIPNQLAALIIENYRTLGNAGPGPRLSNVPVAVRSSATAEDLAGASFAGQQETMLNVIGEEELLHAVRRCWSSLFTSQAIFYRCQCGFDDTEVSMAVVVQKMVNSEKSGVTFTVEPVMRNHYQMVIETVWGLGEGIVSGTITPDHYKMDRETYDVLFEFVPDKQIMFKQMDSGGVQEQSVSAQQVSARVLSNEELKQLVDFGNQVEAHFGCPQDIEWGIEGDQIYLLQSRPITNL